MALIYVDAQQTVPLWIVFSCHVAIALGTMFGGLAYSKNNGIEGNKN